jgi:hypothetical protein
MSYTFDIVGISPVLHFFEHQQATINKSSIEGVEYFGTQIFTLDAVIACIEPVPVKWGWNQDEVVKTAIEFWLKNSESIGYWKLRLDDAGRDNLLVARIADIRALQAEFELLLNKD